MRAVLENLFRHESARLVARLTARAGAARIGDVEDAVQDALVAAMRTWPIQGTPAVPAAWLYTVARNALFDRLRRSRFEVPVVSEHLEALLPAASAPDAELHAASALDDDLLRLILLCCHPTLSHGVQVTLTLRLACGLGADEIAQALLAAPEAITQRIVRGKRELRQHATTLDAMSTRELSDERLPVVLNTLYLLFDAGYFSAARADWLRAALCSDALRLASGLAAHPHASHPECEALAALLSFSMARMPARVNDAGLPVPLAHQDRARWDGRLIDAGFMLLARASRGRELTRYHLEAAIAAEHARAPNFAATDWLAILRQYDLLCERYPSPVVELNRSIAIRYAAGATEALRALEAIDARDGLADSLMWHATLGEVHEALGNADRAVEAYRAAALRAGSVGLAQFFRERAAAAVRSLRAHAS